MKKSYYTVNGRIIAEYDGTTQTDYILDALGSVVGTVNPLGIVVNTYTYKPYGEQLAKTGTGTDPKFGWVGSLGYRKTTRRFSDQYVRARHYGTLQAQWTTVDPLWPGLLLQFIYGASSPSCRVDPTGLDVYAIGCNDPADSNRFIRACEKLRDCLMDKPPGCKQGLLSCIGNVGKGNWVEQVLRLMVNRCLNDKDKVCVVCGQQNLPPGCEKICEGAIGVTPVFSVEQGLFGEPVIDPTLKGGQVVEKCDTILYKACELAIKLAAKGEGGSQFVGCQCVIVFCNNEGRDTSTFIHELAHCVGVGGTDHRRKRNDVVYRIGKCFSEKVPQ